MTTNLNQSRGANAKTGMDSAFYTNIKNTSGLLATKSRADLKNWALRDPAGYTKFRSDVYITVVGRMVEYNYQIIWKLLSQGIYQNESGTDVPMEIVVDKDGNKQHFRPNIPDQEISKISHGFADSVLRDFDAVLSKILPDTYKGLAEDKMSAVTRASGEAGAMRE